jgi:6,7-dimethyl-8-ribityllumazine synthase
MIAIVKSNFNIEITNLLLEGCINELDAQKISYEVFECPGAVETIGLTKRIIEKLQPASVIVIGAIIKGDTDHYEYVCQYVTNGHSTLSAMENIPIVFGILTTQDEQLAMERAALDKMNKGKEFA